MMLTLSMNTAGEKTSRLLSTSIPVIPDILLIMMIFTIDDDGVPICKMGLRMHKDGYEAAKHRAKYRCPKANRKQGCFCEHPCSPAKYGRTVHIFTDDNPRLFNIPPRDSKARHSTRYVQCLCPFLAIFFSCTIFSCQFSVGISFIEIPRSYTFSMFFCL